MPGLAGHLCTPILFSNATLQAALPLITCCKFIGASILHYYSSSKIWYGLITHLA
ncbi:MAG: hypothetical protein RL172_1757 [Bacteroidota bacterium]|jgi:hypothetical protein